MSRIPYISRRANNIKDTKNNKGIYIENGTKYFGQQIYQGFQILKRHNISKTAKVFGISKKFKKTKNILRLPRVAGT